MLASQSLTSIFGLPELEIKKSYRIGKTLRLIECEKKPMQEYCTRCGSGDYWVHQYVKVKIKDAPLRDNGVLLNIRKRRLKCKTCRKVFSEPVPGIMKHSRFT